MSKDQSRGEGGLKVEESGVALFGEAPRSALLSEAGEQNNYVGVVTDEPMIEVCKPKKGLDVFNLAWFRPITNGLDLISRHGQTGWGEDIAEVLDRVFVELTLFWLSKEATLEEAAEDLFYMLAVQLLIVGHVGQDAINKPLESCWHISKTEGHNQPFIGTIVSAKGSFPFVTSTNSD
ncbi:hypothetical protein M404DRAFT_161918 [Pisolithus tinctorius Marx 270]|uniref:Uncharacterized protein n=1 Tax=Pisolithus tinctorius Marx 270 TaxID=870435 RepID=A0A0C3NMP7_PISTI|nr:hypothetical protein M404DRAFT_161918 [Pisolithus tinctorius Marx 270]